MAMRDDAWFAGFAAGEACFQLATVNSRRHIQPRFTLELRADDAPVLEELRAEFGGAIHYVQRAHGLATCQWQVVAKRELVALVDYFDRFELRAKKARDFAIWRRAVELYCASGGGHPELVALRAALSAVRSFDADAPDVAGPFDVQMALGIRGDA